jgi:Cu-Zn family superoxide dismutase
MKNFALLLAALALGLGLIACGGGDDSGSSAAGSESATADNGEVAVAGSFEPIVGVPQPYENVTGNATLVRGDGETRISIDLDGLVPRTKYVAHLHTGGCGGEDPGGPHFKFDPSGGEDPPNEIHLSFTSNGKGSGKAKVTVDREVPADAAGSVVVHTAGDAMTAANSRGTQRFASLLVHEGGEHADDHGSGGHGSDDAPGHDGGGIQPLSAMVACAELEGGATETAAEDASGDVPTIEVENDEPVGGVQELEFDSGEEIRFRVSSDAAEEIHVHGYDIAKDVPAGGSVEFEFPAEIEGIFEVELEELGTQIAELRVNP